MATASLSRLVRRLHHSAESDRLVGLSDEALLDRFLAGDTSAFEQLVWRHGPAVLAACRKVLPVEADVEDAFQATFLTFLRGARSIRARGAVGGWLYGVAHRVAVQALDASARRQRRERRVARAETMPAAADLSWREACAALHEELDRLPEGLRLPLIHCYLQGLSRDEAAKQLGWSAGAVKGRLERGRQLLRDRLARRGITLSVGLLTSLVSSPAVGSVLPPRLVQITLDAATGGRRSAAVAALVQGATRAMVPKRSLAAGLLVAVGLLTAGAALRPSLSAALPSDEPQRPEKTKRSEPPPSITCGGRVLGPDGKPAAGARVYLHSYSSKDGDGPARATSNQDGTFRFTFKVSDLGVTDPDQFGYQVVTTADGFGPGWASLRGSDKATGLTLRLVKDVPIQGRLLDINGKPVVGARLRVGNIRGYADTEAFLQTVREGEFPPRESDWWLGPFPGQPRTLTTGAEGRFTLRGIGRDRLVDFQIEGPGIQYGGVRALTRDLKAAVEPKEKGRTNKPVIDPVYGATFEHAVAPSRPIRGVVRDKQTGKPVAGVTVSAFYTTHRTRTDRDGRYELLGYPKGSSGYDVTYTPAEGQPYFHASLRLPDTEGLTPIRADVELVSGLVVKGRVTHARTGQPIKGVRVSYSPLYPNPAASALATPFPSTLSSATTVADGTYRIVVLLGPGALGFSAYSPKEPFMPAVVTTQDLKDFFKDNLNHGDEIALFTQGPGQTQSLLGQNTFHHLLLIRPGVNDGTITVDVKLQPALAVKGKVVGPEGKPLTGTVAYGLTPESLFHEEALADDAFSVQSVNPRRVRQLVFLHKEKQLGAYVEMKGEKKGPLTVRLEACGTIAGQLIDEDGQPVANVVVRADRERLVDSGPKTRTGKDGRFRLDGLVPGQRYNVMLDRGRLARPLFQPVLLKSGENKDLGAMKINTSNPDE